MATRPTSADAVLAGDSPDSETAAEIVASLRETLGRSLLVKIVAEYAPTVIDDWAASRTEPTAAVAERLRAAVRIAQLLSAVETPAIVRAWFGGRNRLLDDRPPAVVIGSDPAAVWRAARAFRAYG